LAESSDPCSKKESEKQVADFSIAVGTDDLLF